MPEFDMPPRPASFEARGGWLVRHLSREFAITHPQAAGIVGNLGYESGGFEKLHEIGQPEGSGGFGFAQWTSGRRRTFLAYCQQHGLDWRSDDANIGYLIAELRASYSSTITALRRVATVEQAVWSVGQTYERPGGTTADHLPGYEDRLRWAKRALAGAASGRVAAPASPAPALDLTDPIALIRQAQRLLGTEPDGDCGPETRRLARAWRAAHPDD